MKDMIKYGFLKEIFYPNLIIIRDVKKLFVQNLPQT